MPQRKSEPLSFGPFPSAALLEEQHRRDAGQLFSCLAAQAAILLASIISVALAGGIALVQLARYEAALAACAGV